MTYYDLLQKLQAATEEQLAQTVTVYVVDEDEYHGVAGEDALLETDEECDVLDPGHLYFAI